MRKVLGIFTIAVAAFFLIAVSASAMPKSHHHGNQGRQCGEQGDHQSYGGGDNGGRCGCNQDDHFGGQGGDQSGCQGGGQGGQCGEQGDHQSYGDGGNGGQCQCNQDDHFGGQGGDQGDCGGGTPPGGGGGDPTPPPVDIQPTIEGPSNTFLCYSTFQVDPAVYTVDWAWHWLTSASDHYFTPSAVKGNVPYGTNVGGYHLICNAGLSGDKTGTPETYTDSDGQVFDQTWADAMASDYGSYHGMTLNVFPIVG